ncbi:transcriptional regulator [Desulfosporosinus orientis DSM 765]|uniref:Transcriptional regulator n=1 Tax=Desulfosporosinus orientis (strain ATCC 19365 / DSM 765 / NCIMB 8382 / VKM B-1628 / Singapore I) TaxID=768706 RepID=G7WHQ7_DESOD|nr:MarR family transcriptional regulator [Desulfosporosinus orientis]AET69619.1 transcriptional regulator [Desulfosporosinus orientis DSM 765]
MAKNSQDLAQELLRIFSQFKRPSGQHPFSKQGIKPSEFILLNLLLKDCDDNSVGMRVTEISEKLDITPGGVTHTINSLEKGGFIERSADPNDRRIVLVRATEKSQKVIKQLYAEQLHFIEGLVTFLGEQDSQEFIRLFSKTLDYFKESRKK